jgi:EAL domain-containing protein (putative c-di-GMP-specific phosphodiesterase class I)
MLTGVESGAEAANVGGKILDALRTSVRVGGRDLLVHASMGIAIYPEDGNDAESLLKNADTAMYRAKESGRDNYQLYTKALHDAALERLGLECDLRRGIGRGELLLHYQPIYDLRSRRLHGVEALVRWKHPERGLLQPDDFLPMAQKASLTGAIGAWVLRAAGAQAEVWRRRFSETMTMAVNVGSRQLQPEFLNEVGDVLARTGLPAACLDLEITETETMHDPLAAGRMLRALVDLGVSVSIDDFGTGYSSLSYLKDLPCHTLKIDRCFVQNVTTRPGDVAIANTIIALGHNLGLTVLAEGVETHEQRNFLENAGCDRLQGFLYSRPLPARECEQYMAEFSEGATPLDKSSLVH